MQTLKFLKHNVYQRISADGVLTRMGDLLRNDFNALAAALYDTSKSFVVKNGKMYVDSGWNFHLQAAGMFLQKKDANNAWLVSQTDQINLAVDPADPTDRYDTVEARFSLVPQNQQSVDIIDPGTGNIGQQNFYIDNAVKLFAQIKKGTPGAGVAPLVDTATNATFTGSVVLTPSVNLSTKYHLKMSIDGGAAFTVDCRGATPAATTIAEIIAAINLAAPYPVASNDGLGHLKLQAGLGEDGSILFTPPNTNDALFVILGLTISPSYYYLYQGGLPWFKIGEIKVRGASASLLQSDIMDVDSNQVWTAEGTTTARTSSIWDMTQNGGRAGYISLESQVVDPAIGVTQVVAVYYDTGTSMWKKAGSVNSPTGIHVGNNSILLSGTRTGLAAYGPGAGPLYMDASGNIISTQTAVKLGFCKSSTDITVGIDVSPSSVTNIAISSQAEFNSYFSDGTPGWTPASGWTAVYASGYWTVNPPRGTTIWLKNNPSDGVANVYKETGQKAYQLNSRVNMPSDFLIKSVGKELSCVKIQNQGLLTFTTTFQTQKTNCTTTAGSRTVIFANTTGIVAGQRIHLTQADLGGRNFYKILSIAAGVSVELDKEVAGATATATLSVCVENIDLDICLIGRGEYSQFSTISLQQSGGCAFLSYCVKSHINTIAFSMLPGFSAAGLVMYGDGARFSYCWDAKVDRVADCFAGGNITTWSNSHQGVGLYIDNSEEVKAYITDILIKPFSSNPSLVGWAGGGAVVTGSKYCDIEVKNCRLDTTFFSPSTFQGAGLGIYSGSCVSCNFSATACGIYSNFADTYSAAGIYGSGNINCNYKADGCYMNIFYSSVSSPSILGAGIYLDSDEGGTARAYKCTMTFGALGAGSGPTVTGAGIYSATYLRNCSLEAIGCSITGLTSTQSIRGGGIALSAPTSSKDKFFARDCYISGCTAPNIQGGGIYFAGGGVLLSSTIRVMECYLNNAASSLAQGGGIYSATTAMSGCSIFGMGCSLSNSGAAASSGGGFFPGRIVNCSVNLLNCGISTSTGVANGGGIYFSSGSDCDGNDISLANCTINGGGGFLCTGGGGYLNVLKNSFVRAKGCGIIAVSSTPGQGGGLYLGSSFHNNFDLENCFINITSGSGASGYGGGIYAVSSPDCRATLINCLCSTVNSGSPAAQGGGAFLDSNSSGWIINAIKCSSAVTAGATGNAAGGGVWADSPKHILDLIDCSCTGNSSTAGGAYLTANAAYVKVKVTGCFTSGSLATAGGIYSSAPGLTGIIDTCYAIQTSGGTIAGGGAYLGAAALNFDLQIKNCYASGPSAVIGGGAYVASSYGSFRNISNCSCLGAAATKQGGGIYIATGGLYIIFEGSWYNNVALTGPNVFAQTPTGTTGTRQLIYGTTAQYDGGMAGGGSYPF